MSVLAQIKPGNRFVYGKGHELDGQFWGVIDSYSHKSAIVLVDLSDGRREEFGRLEIFTRISQGLLVLDDG
jgi:hypothetical protein